MELTAENIEKIIIKYEPEMAAKGIEGFIKVELLKLESKVETNEKLLRVEENYSKKMYNKINELLK